MTDIDRRAVLIDFAIEVADLGWCIGPTLERYLERYPSLRVELLHLSIDLWLGVGRDDEP